MDFNEGTKKEVRTKARFRCCWCRKPRPIKVHHIIPEEDDGPNTFENAAPLCAECHDTFGHARRNQKQIREARDLWYQEAERIWGAHPEERFDKLDERLNQLIEITSGIQQGQEDLLPQFKAEASEIFGKILIGANPGDSTDIATGLISLSTGTILTEFLECKACGRSTTILTGGLCSECYAQQNPNK